MMTEEMKVDVKVVVVSFVLDKGMKKKMIITQLKGERNEGRCEGDCKRFVVDKV